MEPVAHVQKKTIMILRVSPLHANEADGAGL